MESFQKGPGKVKGIEILFFEEAEIRKAKGDETSFAAFGPLSVLYFKDYNRFVLQLNDWRYPLMRRLIISSSVEGNSNSRTYILPALNGFSFHLKINNVANSEAFQNFETILDHNTRFSVFGKEIPYRKLESSPDDKFPRKSSITTGPKETISETVKKVLQKVQNKTATFKTGTKYLTSTKRKIDLRNIKTKDFKKEAKSRIKKGFFESNEKLYSEFMQKRKNNPNLTQIRDFDNLKKTSDAQAPSLYIFKEDLEAVIVSTREIFSYLSQHEKLEDKKGLITNLREGARSIRDRVSNIVSRDRNLQPPEGQENVEKMQVPEGISHYQG